MLAARDEALVRVDQRDVGVEARGDVALALEAEAARRVVRQQLGHAVVDRPRGLPSVISAGSMYSVPPKPDLAWKMSLRPFLPTFFSVAQQAWSEQTQSSLPSSSAVPEELDVGARADRRIHLGEAADLGVVVEAEVADRDFAAEVDVREGLGHLQRRLHRLARGEVQQVDVEAVGLVREVGGDGDREALGMRRARGAVGLEAGERLAVDALGIGCGR
jgi:hypothetical protein